MSKNIINFFILVAFASPSPSSALGIFPRYGEIIYYPDTRYRRIPAVDLITTSSLIDRSFSFRVSTETRFYQSSNFKFGQPNTQPVPAKKHSDAIYTFSTLLSINLVSPGRTQFTIRVPYYAFDSDNTFNPNSALGDIFLGLSAPVYKADELHLVLSGGIEIPLGIGEYYKEKNPFKAHALRIPLSASMIYNSDRYYFASDVTFVRIGSTDRISLESVSGPYTIARTGGHAVHGMISGGLRYNGHMAKVGLSITEDFHRYIVEPLRSSKIGSIIAPIWRSSIRRWLAYATLGLSVRLFEDVIVDLDLSYDLFALNSFYGFSPAITLNVIR